MVGVGAAVVLAAMSFLPSPSDEAFRWFGGLGFPDVKGCKYVRVATGGWSQSGSKLPEGHLIDAFLLSQSNGTFTVLTKDLFVSTYTATTNGTPRHEQVSFNELDLTKEMEAYLRLLEDPPKDTWRRFGQQLEERAEVFVLAWACDRNGHSALARRLFEQAATMREGGRAKAGLWQRLFDQVKHLLNGTTRRPDMLEQLQRDIGHAMMWRAVVAFGEPAVGRRELLTQFESIISNYPKCAHVPRARETVAILQEMLREDAEHAERKAMSQQEMTRDERVAELIFLLRDQNGHQWSQPGSCDIFLVLDPRQEESPAHQLVKLGYDAMPQLIAALDDKRFTRSVGYHRNFYFSHEVLTVGDCALAVLQRIAGRRFNAPATTSGYMSRDGTSQATKQQAQAWWEDFKKKGEKQLLIETIAHGDDNAPMQAQRLLERYPEAVLAAVMSGITNATGERAREQLVAIASQIPGDAAAAFLAAEVKDGPYLESCVTAACGVPERGRKEAVHALIERWRHSDFGGTPSESSGVEALIGFLVNCGEREAIEALGVDLRHRPVAIRLSVLSAFRERDNFQSVTHGGLGLNPSVATDAPSAETAEAVERFLVAALGDTEQRTGCYGTWDDKSFEDPRICDIAAHVLWKRWPDRYTFDLEGPLKQRERQRFECLNIWHKQNGLPELPLPEARRVPPVAPEKIQPLLQQLRQGKSRKRMNEALRGVEVLGLPALAELHKLSQELPPSHPAHADIDGLTRRLACIVTEVRLGEKSLQPKGPLVALLTGLTNKPLTSVQLVGILIGFANAPPNDSTSIQLQALRDDDLTGVRLEVNLAYERSKQAGTQKGWRTLERVTLDRESIHRSGGMSSLEYGSSREAYSDLSRAIDKALAGPSAIPFIISASLTREQ